MAHGTMASKLNGNNGSSGCTDHNSRWNTTANGCMNGEAECRIENSKHVAHIQVYLQLYMVDNYANNHMHIDDNMFVISNSLMIGQH